MEKDYAAIVLAGGVGSRLRPLTSDLPKPLNPVAGRPMIDYALEMLKKTGINDVVIAVRYLGDKIIDYIGDGSRYGLNVTFPDIDPKGTADAVRLSADYLGDRPFLRTMADVITNLDMISFLEFHESKKNNIASIALKHVDRPSAFGVTMLSPEEQIHLFLEKPEPQELASAVLVQGQTHALHYNLVNMGIYVFDNSILNFLNIYDDIMDFGSEVFPLILNNRKETEKIFGFVSNPYWMDAGTPEKYFWANWDVLRGWAHPYFPKGTKQEGCWIGSDVELRQNLSLNSPAVIGDNTQIENNCKISALSVIGDNVTINESTCINQSIIWDNVTIGRNCKIDHAIICHDVEIKDNVTVDEKSIIGAGASITSNSHLSEKTIITRDKEDKEVH